MRTSRTSVVLVSIPTVLMVACGDASPTKVSTMVSTSTNQTSIPSLDAGGGSSGGADGSGAMDASGAVVASGDADSSSSAESTPPNESASPEAFIRLADWAPDAPAGGFDVCLTTHGAATASGALLAGAGVSAVPFPGVTRYIAVSPGAYDVTLVAGGSSDCANPILPATTLPDVVDGEHATVALLGDVTPTDNDASLAISFFPDDTTAREPAEAALRFINAVPSIGAVDMGSGSAQAGDFSPWFTYVAFGTAASVEVDGGTVDAAGYVAMAPASMIAIAAQVSGAGTGDAATASALSLAAGTVTTLALVNGENGGPAPQFLACTDSQTDSGGTGGAMACALLGP